jgi:hypothetical protein
MAALAFDVNKYLLIKKLHALAPWYVLDVNILQRKTLEQCAHCSFNPLTICLLHRKCVKNCEMAETRPDFHFFPEVGLKLSL